MFSTCSVDPALSHRTEKDPSSGGFGGEVAQNLGKRFIFLERVSKMKVRPLGKVFVITQTTLA